MRLADQLAGHHFGAQPVLAAQQAGHG
jgi:hypothetical protein